MNRFSRAFILFIAQGACSGRSPFAPGTAGTLVAVVFYLGAKSLSLPAYGFVCVLLCVVGTWAADRAELLLGCKDCSSIVIDEIAGFFISMFMVPAGWGFLAAGFLLFRAFDVLKPWPLHGLQDVRGGLGVMLDDIGAGIYTNILLQVAAHFTGR